MIDASATAVAAIAEGGTAANAPRLPNRFPAR
jgi:hypothetical protein